MNNYITYLNILTFTALFIICFVFIFNPATEIIGMGILTVFSSFFLLFIIQTIAIYASDTMNFIPIFAWLGIFIGMVFKIVSLILIMIMFNRLNLGFTNADGKSTVLPKKYKNMMKNFKILFIMNIAFIILLMLVLIYNFTMLNQEFLPRFNEFIEYGSYEKFKLLLGPIAILFTSFRLMMVTSYEVYLGDQFSKLERKKVVIM